MLLPLTYRLAHDDTGSWRLVFNRPGHLYVEVDTLERSDWISIDDFLSERLTSDLHAEAFHRFRTFLELAIVRARADLLIEATERERDLQE